MRKSLINILWAGTGFILLNLFSKGILYNSESKTEKLKNDSIISELRYQKSNLLDENIEPYFRLIEKTNKNMQLLNENDYITKEFERLLLQSQKSVDINFKLTYEIEFYKDMINIYDSMLKNCDCSYEESTISESIADNIN